MLEGSIRRAGDRLRITTQLVDAATGYPVWSERYDRELKDVFELQDEIARKIAEALRIKLSRQEQEALAAKPTDNLQAYDLYLRGRSYARRLTRQDLEFALQMLENAVTQDPEFALAYAAIANVCAYYHAHYAREDVWLHRARVAAERAMTLQPDVPEVMVAQAWILYANGPIRRNDRDRPQCDRPQARLRRGVLPSPSRPLRLRKISGRRQRRRRRRSNRAAPTTTCTCRS